MGAGGGTFTAMNKILPGAYINFVSHPRAMATVGVRGTVTGLLNPSWGPQGEIVTVEAADFQTNALRTLGYSFTAPEMQLFRELFRGARTLKYYRPTGGTAATATVGALTVTALYPGTRGNDLKIIVEADVDEAGAFFVATLIKDGEAYVTVDEQRVRNISELAPNAFVRFTGTTIPGETAGTSLSGGTNVTSTGSAHSQFLGLAEKESFTTVFYTGSDSVTKGLYAAFTRRLRDDEGYKVTCVLHNYPQADHEGIISVKNEVGGANPAALVYWAAGAQAGCEINQSLKNSFYTGELEVKAAFSNRELENAIQEGAFTLFGERGAIRVLADINSFTSVSPHKNNDFSQNQVIRVLDEIGNSTARLFNDLYLGRVQNSAMGRTLLRGDFISYYQQLQAMEAIENFDPDDITIGPGQEKGDVTAESFVQPLAAMQKLYLTVRVV